MTEPTHDRGGWIFQAQPTHASSLAVVRFAVFATIALTVDVENVAWFATLPASLLFPPTGTGWLIGALPLQPEIVTGAAIALKLAAGMAALGLYTRATTILTVLLAFFVLLVPQLFGKVNHYHHLLWFAAILAASPCGDALSIDRGMGRIDSSLTRERHERYYWPLAAIWVLIGIIYFFPGISKLLVSGPDWALSDNLKFQMYAKWFELGDWRPIFRLDRYPLLFKGVGIYTIAFELSFILLILHRRTRRFAALAGVTFHLGTGLFMRIFFVSLVVAYTAFVDWERALRNLGLKGEVSEPADGVAHPSGFRRSALALVAGVLIAGNIWAGVTRTEAGWPFAAYPSFTPARTAPVTQTLLVTVSEEAEAEERLLFSDDLYQNLGSARYTGLIRSLLSVQSPTEQRRRFQGFGDFLAREIGGVNEGDFLRIYAVVFDSRPRETDDLVAIGRRLLYEWQL